jgi:hypothetical protein
MFSHLRAATYSCVVALCPQPVLAAGTPPYFETQTLRIANPGPLDDLGYSLGVDDGWLVAGAINVADDADQDVGAAYVYRQAANNAWLEDGVLTPHDGNHNDAFGSAVDVDGGIIIVGASSHDALGDRSGAAYIFAKRGSDEWQEVAKLLAPDGSHSEQFGSRVQLNGKLGAVAAPFADESPASGSPREKGAVYFFHDDGLQTWNFSSKLQPADIAYGDRFGFSLDIFGDTLVATTVSVQNLGVPWRGSAYIFKTIDGTWTQTDKLIPPGLPGGGVFAFDAALGEGRMVLGTLGDSNRGSHGTAYIYEENRFGQWEQTAELIPHDIDKRWFYGSEVSLFGDIAAVVGFNSPTGTNEGVAYVFKRSASGSWTKLLL